MTEKKEGSFLLQIQKLLCLQQFHLVAVAVLCLCVPISLLASSPSFALAWIGRVGIVAAFLASIAANLKGKVNIHSAAILIFVSSLIIIGVVSERKVDPQSYIQFIQIIMFGAIVFKCRSFPANFINLIILYLFILAFIISNFLFKVEVLSDEIHNFDQLSGLFGNPNVFALGCSALLILSFQISRAVNNRAAKVAAYAYCLIFFFFIMESGARGALLVVGVYFVVYILGWSLKGFKPVLTGIGIVSIFVIVPAVTLGYPMALGQKVDFSPPAASFAPAFPYPQQPNNVSRVDLPKMADGGFFGVNKNIASGRHIIWPLVIELSGETPVWGHGLGSLPGTYLPWPYNGRSAHNGFLQIYYQFGLVGLGLYAGLWCLLFLRAASLEAWNARIACVAALSAACILEIFEVALIQNHFGIGMAFAILATTEFTVRTKNPLSSTSGAA